MKIIDALKGSLRLGIDTSPYIYYIENHPTYAAKVDNVLEYVENNQIQIHTSVIALTEILMKPLQMNDQTSIKIYLDLLTNRHDLHLVPVTMVLAQKAAALRANYNLRTPDALHIASAIDANCDAFLTNDFGLKRIKELQILILDELEI